MVARSNLSRDAAQARYVRLAELAALEQIRDDAKAIDSGEIAIGPFARLDAGAVAAREGKTRGAITNLFGSQAALQIETMKLALSAIDLVEALEYPDPADYDDADAWVDALFAGQAERGPVHGAKPKVDYAALWTLWLSAVPYGVWSESIADPSLEENRAWITQLATTLQSALDHFDAALRPGTTVDDLACAAVALVEGAWLNQCLTKRHPTNRAEPIATVLRRSGRLLWAGATVAG